MTSIVKDDVISNLRGLTFILYVSVDIINIACWPYVQLKFQIRINQQKKIHTIEGIGGGVGGGGSQCAGPESVFGNGTC